MKPVVVLFRPQFSGNLGSVARAMKNMGLKELLLVEPEVTPRDAEAKRMAAHAQDVLDQARSFTSLEQALQGFHEVVGTSRRMGGDRPPSLDPRAFAASLSTFPEDYRLALLFGPEDTGLTQRELRHCHRLIHIPSHDDFPSLNLAQAVLVVAYELRMLSELAWAAPPPPVPTALPAPWEDLEHFYRDLEELLAEGGFLDPKNHSGPMGQLRRLFHRAIPTVKEVKLLRGVCRQLRWWGRRPTCEEKIPELEEASGVFLPGEGEKN